MSLSQPRVSVVIPTKDRGASVVPTVESVLANSYPDLVVTLIDQSTSSETEAAIQPLKNDPRFRYTRSNRTGVAHSRNMGLTTADSELVLYTDDDCEVPRNWVAEMVSVFERHPRAAVVFCSVGTPPYDYSMGYIPDYPCTSEKVITNSWEKMGARGIGAGMGVKRRVLLDIGGFDNQLGPGSKYWSSEDGDIAVRALISGWHVVETNRVAVVHHGFRERENARALARRDWMAIGAMYSKVLRCGHWEYLPVVVFEAFFLCLLKPLCRLMSIRKPQGLRNFFYFWMGFFQSLKTPVDSDKVLFMPVSND